MEYYRDGRIEKGHWTMYTGKQGEFEVKYKDGSVVKKIYKDDKEVQE